MTVRIKVQEFIRNGTTMYRVMSIRGVLTRERLDEGYVSSMPSFWLTQSRKTIKLYDGTTLSVNGEYRRPVFMRILKQINLAGDRLHKINREKHISKINQGINQGRWVAKDTPVAVRSFKV